jgi:serine/threonine-protein kinase
MLGKILDNRYRLDELVGSGGMANVYKSTDLEDNKIVALKLLHSELVSKPEFLKRFRAEAQAIISLAHPNIVKIYNVNFYGDEPYIVMEYIDGITLKQHLTTEKQVDRREAVHFTLQILRALNHAHAKGIIHCDIKPHNIMVLGDDTVKMMDFGIARIARDPLSSDSENTIGSVHYLSPEQAMGEEVEPASDVYSVGVMLYEMLTGQKPFDGKDVNEIAQKHLYETPVPPKRLNPEIPIGLQEIILKSLEKNIKYHTRYEDAAEMLKDLEAYKYNNNITFGYVFSEAKEKVKMYNNNQDEEIRYRRTENLTAPEEEEETEYYEEEEYEEDETDVIPEGKSMFVPILSAVTIVVIIAAVFFVVSLVNDAFGEGGNTIKKTAQFELQNLVGMSIDEAGEYCKSKGLELDIKPEAIPSEYGVDIICEQAPPANKKVSKGQVITVTVSSGMPVEVEVPNVIGQDYNSAQDALELKKLRCKYEFAASTEYSLYQVMAMSPTAGSMVPAGTEITITVSTGAESQPEIEVPDFTHMDIADARLKAQYAGVVLKVNPVAENSSEPEGTVIRQNPVKGSKVIKGVEVEVVLSNGISNLNEVEFTIDLPTGYIGAYIIEIMTEPSVTKSFNVGSQAGVSFTLNGTGQKDYTVNLWTSDKQHSANAGVITIDFTTKAVDMFLLNLDGAFASIGTPGVANTTTPPLTTTTGTATTTTGTGSTTSDSQTTTSDTATTTTSTTTTTTSSTTTTTTTTTEPTTTTTTTTTAAPPPPEEPHIPA